jgi:hypothetical protein
MKRRRPLCGVFASRRQFDTSKGYQGFNSKASSDVQPPRIGPRTVKTGCGVFRKGREQGGAVHQESERIVLLFMAFHLSTAVIGTEETPPHGRPEQLPVATKTAESKHFSLLISLKLREPANNNFVKRYMAYLWSST